MPSFPFVGAAADETAQQISPRHGSSPPVPARTLFVYEQGSLEAIVIQGGAENTGAAPADTAGAPWRMIRPPSAGLQTTLAAAVAIGDPTITVRDATQLMPAVPPKYRVWVGDEYMTVVAQAGNVLTLNATATAAHPAGTPVVLSLHARTLARFSPEGGIGLGGAAHIAPGTFQPRTGPWAWTNPGQAEWVNPHADVAITSLFSNPDLVDVPVLANFMAYWEALDIRVTPNYVVAALLASGVLQLNKGLTVTAQLVTDVLQVLRAMAGQTADLFQAYDSSGNLQWRLNAAGVNVGALSGQGNTDSLSTIPPASITAAVIGHATNGAWLHEVRPARRILATKLFVWVATQSGNWDIGIYDAQGVPLWRQGALAVPAPGFQTIVVAPAVPMEVGIQYYLAVSADNNAYRLGGTTGLTGASDAARKLNGNRVVGIQAAVAHPLPNPIITPPGTANNNYYYIGVGE